jgi:hypothetical protein
MTDNDDDDQKIYCISKRTTFSLCVSQNQSFIRNAFILSLYINSSFFFVVSHLTNVGALYHQLKVLPFHFSYVA